MSPTGGAAIAVHRRRLGAFGEQVAADFLVRNGVSILDRNVKVGRGEIDLIGRDEKGQIAIEVKTAVASADDHPRHHFTDSKARQVSNLAR